MSESTEMENPLDYAIKWARELQWEELEDSDMTGILKQLELASRILHSVSAAGCSEFAERSRRAGRSTGSAATTVSANLGVPTGHVRGRIEAGYRAESIAGRALAEGRIAAPQESDIARAVEGLPDRLTAEERTRYEQALVDLACTGAWTRKLNSEARSRLYELAPETQDADEREQQRKRSVSVTPADSDGIAHIGIHSEPRLQALLDAVLAKFGRPGQCISATPDPETGSLPDASELAADDCRTPGQRAYDALCHVLALGLGADESGAKGVANIVVRLSPEQLDAIETGGGLTETDSGTTLSTRQAVSLVGSRPWFVSCLRNNREELHRIDVDRFPKRRLAGILQRLVLYAAHGGCTHPGCFRPATVCQAHHLEEFSRGGPTTVENLTLACPTHHGWVGSSRDRWRTKPDPDHPGRPKWVPPATPEFAA